MKKLDKARVRYRTWTTEQIMAMLKNSIRCQYDAEYCGKATLHMMRKFPRYALSGNPHQRTRRHSRVSERMAAELLMERGLGRMEVEALRTAARKMYGPLLQ